MVKLEDIIHASKTQHATSFANIPPARPMTYLIIGASRGIGLEFVRQLLEQQHQVIAVVRSVESASLLWQLTNITSRPHQCIIEQCDVADPVQIDIFVDRMRNLVERGGNIDTVVLNAGILHYDKGLGSMQVEFADLMHHLTVNCVGNVVLARKLLELNELRSVKQEREQRRAARSRSANRRAEARDETKERVKRIKTEEDEDVGVGDDTRFGEKVIGRQIVFMSSDSGSMADFREYEVGFAAYGASKAALNMMIRHMAVELRRRSEKQTSAIKTEYLSFKGGGQAGSAWEKEVCVLAMHPGEVETDMASINSHLDWEVEGLISPEESVRCMLRVLEDKGPSYSGTFWRWDGSEHPW